MSGLLNLEGGAARVINHIRNDAFEIVITREIFGEYIRVIHFFDNDIPSVKSEELLELVFEKAVKVQAITPRGLCKDPDDEIFLTAALSGQAGYLVTKNKRDFPRDASGVRVVNVREFLNAIERRGAG
ncbi:MAG: putative toxin-antitoxin system toxin component, PIN family [Deltaproteobacteria bacterium]|nr:putative toxin-antitoxin system toxin component, PIN family [Deltaproteobacteria bacterium]